MTEQIVISALCEILELPEGSLQAHQLLNQYPGWDSMAKLGFIAAIENRLKVVVDGTRVGSAETVRDLIRLVSSGLEKIK